MKFRSALVPAAGLAAALSLTAAAQAGPPPNIVLTIDITTPTAVVIASTDAPSLVTRNVNGDAIRLPGFLLADPRLIFPLIGTLKAAQGTFVPSRFNTNGGGELMGDGFQSYTFVTGLRAFSGSSQVDLSLLPTAAVGTIGDVTVRDPFGNNTGLVVGQYLVIPSPGAAALLGLGGVVATRRRR